MFKSFRHVLLPLFALFLVNNAYSMGGLILDANNINLLDENTNLIFDVPTVDVNIGSEEITGSNCFEAAALNSFKDDSGIADAHIKIAQKTYCEGEGVKKCSCYFNRDGIVSKKQSEISHVFSEKDLNYINLALIDKHQKLHPKTLLTNDLEANLRKQLSDPISYKNTYRKLNTMFTLERSLPKFDDELPNDQLTKSLMTNMLLRNYFNGSGGSKSCLTADGKTVERMDATGHEKISRNVIKRFSEYEDRIFLEKKKLNLNVSDENFWDEIEKLDFIDASEISSFRNSIQEYKENVNLTTQKEVSEEDLNSFAGNLLDRTCNYRSQVFLADYNRANKQVNLNPNVRFLRDLDQMVPKDSSTDSIRDAGRRQEFITQSLGKGDEEKSRMLQRIYNDLIKDIGYSKVFNSSIFEPGDAYNWENVDCWNTNLYKAMNKCGGLEMQDGKMFGAKDYLDTFSHLSNTQWDDQVRALDFAKLETLISSIERANIAIDNYESGLIPNDDIVSSYQKSIAPETGIIKSFVDENNERYNPFQSPAYKTGIPKNLDNRFASLSEQMLTNSKNIEENIKKLSDLIDSEAKLVEKYYREGEKFKCPNLDDQFGTLVTSISADEKIHSKHAPNIFTAPLAEMGASTTDTPVSEAVIENDEKIMGRPSRRGSRPISYNNSQRVMGYNQANNGMQPISIDNLNSLVSDRSKDGSNTGSVRRNLQAEPVVKSNSATSTGLAVAPEVVTSSRSGYSSESGFTKPTTLPSSSSSASISAELEKLKAERQKYEMLISLQKEREMLQKQMNEYEKLLYGTEDNEENKDQKEEVEKKEESEEEVTEEMTEDDEVNMAQAEKKETKKQPKSSELTVGGQKDIKKTKPQNVSTTSSSTTRASQFAKQGLGSFNQNDISEGNSFVADETREIVENLPQEKKNELGSQLDQIKRSFNTSDSGGLSQALGSRIFDNQVTTVQSFSSALDPSLLNAKTITSKDALIKHLSDNGIVVVDDSITLINEEGNFEVIKVDQIYEKMNELSKDGKAQITKNDLTVEVIANTISSEIESLSKSNGEMKGLLEQLNSVLDESK